MYEIINMFDAPEHLDEKAYESEVNSRSALQVHCRTRQGSHKGWGTIS